MSIIDTRIIKPVNVIPSSMPSRDEIQKPVKVNTSLSDKNEVLKIYDYFHKDDKTFRDLLVTSLESNPSFAKAIKETLNKPTLKLTDEELNSMKKQENNPVIMAKGRLNFAYFTALTSIFTINTETSLNVDFLNNLITSAEKPKEASDYTQLAIKILSFASNNNKKK